MKAGWRGNRADRAGVRFSLVRNLSPAPPFRTSEWLGAWQGVGGVGRGWFYIPAQQGDLSVSSGGRRGGVDPWMGFRYLRFSSSAPNAVRG